MKSEKKIRVAFVVNDFPNLSETFIINQIIFLINRGHEVTIFSRSKGDVDRVHHQIIEYSLLDRVVFVPPIPKTFIKRFWVIFGAMVRNFNFLFTLEILKCLNVFKVGKHAVSLYVAYNFLFLSKLKECDIIHAHFGSSGLWMAFYKKVGLFKGIPLIVSFHGYDLSPHEQKINSIRYKDLFNFSSKITVNSLYAKEQLRHIGFDDSSRIVLLPIGLDLAQFNKKTYSPRIAINILFCGRLIPLKGARIAIEVVNILIKKFKFLGTLTIVGDGLEYEELQHLVKAYQIDNYVRFRGGLLQSEVVEEFDKADIFLFPGIEDPITGRCETQGLVVQEAQAMKLPVVVSDAGGLKFGMRQGESGFVVPAGNVEEFVVAVRKLIDNQYLREKMGDAGRKFVENKYSYLALGEDLESLYFESIVAI